MDLQALARAGVELTPAVQELMSWLAGPSDEGGITSVEADQDPKN
jgi:hypothetical protein